jgi:LysR family glycine cleavage system transcriptional activator
MARQPDPDPAPIRRDRLPSLRALRTFEVVGRHLNMQHAADELCITVSAVSHQIRDLEAELGVSLFRRTGRGLAMTKEGAGLLPSLIDVFDHLAAAIEGFRRRLGPEIVTISMPASFAMRWFIPRLSRFQDRHPDIEIRVATHVGREVQRNLLVDCFIHLGGEDWPDFRGELLFTEQLHAVCSPAILARPGQAIEGLTDILKHRLLRSDDRADEWSFWTRSLALQIPANQRVVSFTSRNLAIQAAIEGLGVTLAEPVEIADDLLSGRLVQPLGPHLSVPTRGYYFHTGEAARGPSAALVRAWLLEELANRSAM